MLNGILNIDKPAGITSHDAVDQVRKLSGQRRVGHAGTLDPFATGVLVMAVGQATRLLEYTRDLPKTYRATLHLGATSSTDDRTGEIIRAPLPRPLPKGARGIQEILQQFTGQIEQTPPAYAAIKVRGKKLYELARQDLQRAQDEAKKKIRTVTVYDIKLLAYDYPALELKIICGGGTYIRSLARDIGQALGTGAYVEQLRRTAVGQFTEAIAVKLGELSAANFPAHLQPPEVLVHHLPRIVVDEGNAAKLRQGNAVAATPPRLPSYEGRSIAVFDENGALIAIARWDPSSRLLSPVKVFDFSAIS